MIKFKGCPKCHGDLYLNQDMYGKYWNCLQCGYVREPHSEAVEAQRVLALTRTGGRQAA